MSEDMKHESEWESKERCGDKKYWHKHHHKHDRDWCGGPMLGGPICGVPPDGWTLGM